MIYLRLARSFFFRDLMIDASYKASLVLEAINILVSVAAFFYLSRFMGINRPEGYAVFSFLLVGLAANSAMNTALTCFTQAVKQDQQTGAIKPLLISPLGPAALVTLGGIYPIIRGTVNAGVFLLAGIIFGMTYRSANILGSGVVAFVALAAFAALGMFSAACILVLKRGDPVLWLFAAFSWLLGGVFFPVNLLPPPLRQAAEFFPMTHALNALRATMLGGASLASVSREVALLGAIAAIGAPLSALTLHLGTDHVKKTGTLGHS